MAGATRKVEATAIAVTVGDNQATRIDRMLPSVKRAQVRYGDLPILFPRIADIRSVRVRRNWGCGCSNPRRRGSEEGKGDVHRFRHIRTWMSKFPAAQMLRLVLGIGLNFAEWRKDVMMLSRVMDRAVSR